MNGTTATLRRLKRDTKEFVTLFGKTAVVLFVAWHMAAVLIISLPSGETNVTSKGIRDDLLPMVTPYLMVTSQWQSWELFAPDPLRTVMTFAVDAEDGTRWKTVAAIGKDTFPWWRHATYAKLLPAILDKTRNDYDVFRERFLQMMCADLDIPEGTLVRLRDVSYNIPYLEAHASADWWKTWTPSTDTTVIRMTNCHPSAL